MSQLYLPMVIYAPALAIMEITAWRLWITAGGGGSEGLTGARGPG